jgi:RNA-binding protein YlmH
MESIIIPRYCNLLTLHSNQVNSNQVKLNQMELRNLWPRQRCVTEWKCNATNVTANGATIMHYSITNIIRFVPAGQLKVDYVRVYQDASTVMSGESSLLSSI